MPEINKNTGINKTNMGDNRGVIIQKYLFFTHIKNVIVEYKYICFMYI